MYYAVGALDLPLKCRTSFCDSWLWIFCLGQQSGRFHWCHVLRVNRYGSISLLCLMLSANASNVWDWQHSVWAGRQKLLQLLARFWSFAGCICELFSGLPSAVCDQWVDMAICDAQKVSLQWKDWDQRFCSFSLWMKHLQLHKSEVTNCFSCMCCCRLVNLVLCRWLTRNWMPWAVWQMAPQHRVLWPIPSHIVLSVCSFQPESTMK